jgi:hypothetical protein
MVQFSYWQTRQYREKTKGSKVIENQAKSKQTTRLRKVECSTDKYIVRVSRSTLITFGAPICPACSLPMTEGK